MGNNGSENGNYYILGIYWGLYRVVFVVRFKLYCGVGA